MTTLQIFGLQFLLSLVLYTLIARWHVAPRLAALPLASALSPLLFLHAFRHLGLVFLVPTVVGSSLPPSRPRSRSRPPTATCSPALLAIVALRSRWPFGLPLVWLFNVVGTVDLVNALAQGLRLDVSLGAAYYIPTFAVPALFVTHAMIFAMLVRRAR